MTNIRVFLSENFQLLEVKFSIYLNRSVFIIDVIIQDICVIFPPKLIFDYLLLAYVVKPI